MHFGEHDFFK